MLILLKMGIQNVQYMMISTVLMVIACFIVISLSSRAAIFKLWIPEIFQEPQGLLGDFQGFHKYISFTVKLVNVILIFFKHIFYIPLHLNILLGLFQCKSPIIFCIL